MLENSVEIDILEYATEMTVEVTTAMLLSEARRRGKMLVRTKAGDIFEIKHIDPED